MITFAQYPFTKSENLKCLNKEVRKWFVKKFKSLTPPQRYSFKLISQNKNTLITAPTGSGKTFSVFMVILSKLFDLAERQKLEAGVYCLYISPLRALDNDIYRNLLEPLREMNKEEKIRVAIRTGDITQYERAQQLKKPPHILITTPESLAILLNSIKFAEFLRTIKWVVVDEIHELASSKRGAHLSLSLERLQELIGKNFVRIGLGATLHPLEEAARFLVGCEKGKERNCNVVDVSWFKKFDLELICPTKDIIHTTADKMNALMYQLLDKLISKHRTTLVFTNTRSGTERVVYHLKSLGKYPEESIEAHHGSLAREIRWDVEERLKRGLLKAVISSTSLELGIDIGYIDLVVQLGSPKSVTRCVQRIGRSGHGLLDIAKGKVIALDRDDLVECAVMLKCAQQRELDKMQVVRNCLDVLAQHIVGMALTRKWNVKEAFEVVRSSYCYKDLDYEDFFSLLHYIAGHYADLEDRNVYGKIWFDEKDLVFGRRGKYTKVIYYLNLGTIPDEVQVDVYNLEPYHYVGNIEEDFLERLRKGDIFVLGGRTYEFRYARGMRCFVQERKEELPTIPAWFSELLPLSYELALEIGKFRAQYFELLNKKDVKNIKRLLEKYQMDENSKKAIQHYFQLQYDYLGIFPTDKILIIEDTFDLRARRILVFHFLFGRRVNDALSRIFGFIIGKLLKADLGIIVCDNGFGLIVPANAEINMPEIFEKLFSTDLYELLKSNVRKTELMKRRFRHCSTRGFLVLRNYKGHKIRVARQQLNAQMLLQVCEEISENFPIIKETYREILKDVMDIENAKKVLDAIKNKEIKYYYLKTELPSPFAHNLILLGEADIILMKDRRERLIELHEKLMRKLNEGDTYESACFRRR
ncbi:MAG: ATP-dependent helicase [Candidatus Thermoplasmatota archaeon]|nr:ATP-dependent helicase [Candidatus Thermoplasmatota archaeon]